MRKKLISKLICAGLVLNLTFFFYPQEKLFTNKVSSVAYAADSTSLPANTKDGAILHAFDWSFTTIKNELSNIAAAGYKSIQVSPVQGTKESSTDPSKWWLLYQPTNQSIGNSQLGSYNDFKSLCTEAEKYKINIIVDVVMNHMAGTGEALANEIDSSFKNSNYYHHNGQCNNWNSRYDITQLGIGMPDLNTQNPEVQSKAISFLNQCVDAGADGFRFDAAKHIETNSGLDANKSWSGNYWNNVLGNLHNKSNLFNYGEVLQDGTVDNVSAYESLMNVTASSYGYSLRNAITSNNLSSIGTAYSGIGSGKAVTFVETHDNFEDGTSKSLSNNQIKLGWAIAAARNSATPLFFSRPNSSIGKQGDSLWKDPDIVAINKFRNSMVGQAEYLRWTNNNSTMLIDRGTIGTVIVNDGSSTYVSSPTNLANGTYTNKGSANCTLTVSNGTIYGNIPAYSVIILDKAIDGKRVSWTPENPIAGQTVTITYDASKTLLLNSSKISIHWGYDGFTGAADTAMTSAGNNIWSVTLKVPSSAKSKLDLCFTNGSSWDSNGSANWSIPIKGSSTIFVPHQGYTVDYDSSTLTKGNSFTIYYNGSLANSSRITLHWGYNGWGSPADVVMTKDSSGFWKGTLTIPASATKLDFCFTNGSSWDNNGKGDWHLSVS